MTVLPPDKPHKAGGGIYYHVDCESSQAGSGADGQMLVLLGLTSGSTPSVSPRVRPIITFGMSSIADLAAWEQMSIAAAFNTTQIWIVNVGSLKPLEMPTEHFLNLAWDIDAWPINSVDRYLQHWAAREFGEEVSHEVADIMSRYSVCLVPFAWAKGRPLTSQMYASRNKAELVNSTAYSFVNYEEYVCENLDGITIDWQG